MEKGSFSCKKLNDFMVHHFKKNNQIIIMIKRLIFYNTTSKIINLNSFFSIVVKARVFSFWPIFAPW
jgi:hypothetical protein